jgi:hypothetical protein
MGNRKRRLIMRIKDIAKEVGVPLWKVYYIINKLNLDRIPTVKEVKDYIENPPKKGRPIKYTQKGDN